MKLVFIGTSAAQPTPERGLSCICLQKDDEILMFDAGEGAQLSYLKSGLGWNKKMKIFVTHMHGDHCIGILGLLQTMTLQHRTQEVEIFGPEGIEEFIAENIKILKFGLSFPVIINSVKKGVVVEETNYFVLSAEANHSINSFSYVFLEKDKPGRFYPEKARALDIPEGELWNKLQKGNQIIFQGNKIKPEQVMGEKRPGVKIGISGDTRPTTNLVEFFKNCDYLIFDSTFLDELRQKAKETFHSTAKEAAELAKSAGVKKLILTHFSARYQDVNTLVEEAKKTHPSVIGAKDLLQIEI